MFATAKPADPADYDCTQLHFDESVLTTPSGLSTVSTFRVIDVIVFNFFFQVEDAFVFHDASIAKGEGLVFIGMKCHLCVFVEVTVAAVFSCLKCFQ